MSASSDLAAETTDLRVEFRTRQARVTAVDGVSLSARRGEITTILGTNGAGKSTLLRVLQGLASPTSGSARVLGQDVRTTTAEHRARVGVMLQESGLPPAARPMEFLEHMSRFYANPRPVADLARDLGIDEFTSTSIRRLSGGQRQRVALAAAVVGRPLLCMLDEPSAGLDPVSREMVVRFIEGLRDEGTSVILTTHLLDDAERLSDAVHILSKGRVRQSGTLEELISASSAKTLTVSAHPDAGDTIAQLVDRARALGLAVEEDRQPRSLRVRVHGDIPASLTAQAAQCGREPDEPPLALSLTQANLTDVFFQTAKEDA